MRGTVLSLHVHPVEHGQSMVPMPLLDCVEGKGIRQDKRYFGRRSRSGGPFKRQVTIVERETNAEHADVLDCEIFKPGVVRSNIETAGIALLPLLGRHVQIGSAVFFFLEPRTPCSKMDDICHGLRALMENGRQGVIAQVIRSGSVTIGDAISLLPPDWVP